MNGCIKGQFLKTSFYNFLFSEQRRSIASKSIKSHQHFACSSFIFPPDMSVLRPVKMILVGYKFMTFLDSCDLKQLVNQPTHLHGHILDLILFPSDQDTIVDIKIVIFISDHTLDKCSIAFPQQVTHIPHAVHYRRYHCINISDFHSDLKTFSLSSLQLML